VLFVIACWIFGSKYLSLPTGKLPEDVHDDYLLSVPKHVNDVLQIKNYFNIIVIGKRDIFEDELFISYNTKKHSAVKKTDKSDSPSPSIVVCYFELGSAEGDHYEVFYFSIRLSILVCFTSAVLVV
jgi:hypothetical protein